MTDAESDQGLPQCPYCTQESGGQPTSDEEDRQEEALPDAVASAAVIEALLRFAAEFAEEEKHDLAHEAAATAVGLYLEEEYQDQLKGDSGV